MATEPDQTPDGDKTAIPLAGSGDHTLTRSPAPAATSAAPESSLALPVGTRLHEFAITGVIGEGGFGIVYAAHDHSLDRDVAIKEYIPSALAARSDGISVSVRSNRHLDTFNLGLRSFVNEAKLLAQFDHRSLVKVFRFWEAHGTAYMAMPHYRGETLKSRIKQTTTPPDEAWLRNLLSTLLDALEVIHQENVFHRDIAPDNILLLDEDRPLLLDFGAARRVIGDATQGLTVILKPGYAPIEQYADVKSMKQGAWTDLYALAATVYFAVAGKPPEPSVGRMMADHLVPMIELGRGRYSEVFLSAIDTALRVKPEDRPRNVAAFRTLLDLPHSEHKPKTPAPHKVPGKRSRIPWPAVGAGLTLAVLLSIGSYRYFLQDDTRPGPTPSAEKPVAEQALPQAATPVPAASTPASLPGEKAEVASPEPAMPESRPPAPTDPAASTKMPAPPPVAVSVPASPPAVDKPPVPKPVAVQPPPPAVAAQKKTEIVPIRPLPAPAPDSVVGQKSYLQPEKPRDNIQPLVSQARQSLARKEFRRAIGFADNVLALDPNNVQASDIRQRALAGEKRAFDDIKIE